MAGANDAGTILLAPSYPGACGWGPDHPTAVERPRTDIRFTRDWLDAHGLLQPRHRRVPEDHRAEEWTVDGERWTVEKVLRRPVWHELLHYKQLRGVVPKVLDETG